MSLQQQANTEVAHSIEKGQLDDEALKLAAVLPIPHAVTIAVEDEQGLEDVEAPSTPPLFLYSEERLRACSSCQTRFCRPCAPAVSGHGAPRVRHGEMGAHTVSIVLCARADTALTAGSGGRGGTEVRGNDYFRSIWTIFRLSWPHAT